MWGWETLIIPTPGFWYFQGLLAQWSSFWLTTHWTLHKSSTGFLAENFQLPTRENGGNLGPCSLFCSYNLGLTINSNVSPEFNSIIKIYSLGLNKAPWALEAHLSYTQIEAANSRTSIRVHLFCCYLWTHEKSICLLAIPLEGKAFFSDWELDILCKDRKRRWKDREKWLLGIRNGWGIRWSNLKQNFTIS